MTDNNSQYINVSKAGNFSFLNLFYGSASLFIEDILHYFQDQFENPDSLCFVRGTEQQYQVLQIFIFILFVNLILIFFAWKRYSARISKALTINHVYIEDLLKKKDSSYKF